MSQALYNDMVYLVAPQSAQTGSAMINMAGYGNVYLDSQFSNGDSNGTLFKYELIYYPTTTLGGNVENLKLPQPDNIVEPAVVDYGNDKEAYRWHYLITNRRRFDEYDPIISMGKNLWFEWCRL